MDITSISAAYNAVKFAKDALKVSLNYKIEIEAREKVLVALERLGDLQDVIFKLQEDRVSQQSEIERLRSKLKEKDDWETTKANYKLEQTVGGAVVYAFRGSPKHFACPSCYSNKKVIEILQGGRDADYLDCSGCKAVFAVGSFENVAEALSGRAKKRAKSYSVQ